MLVMTRVLSVIRRPASAIRHWFGFRDGRDGGSALRFTYDPDTDHLIGHLGRPQPCFNVEVPPGVVIRVSQESHTVAGLEVVDCAALFHKHPKAITQGFAMDLLDTYGPRAIELYERQPNVRVCA